MWTNGSGEVTEQCGGKDGSAGTLGTGGIDVDGKLETVVGIWLKGGERENNMGLGERDSCGGKNNVDNGGRTEGKGVGNGDGSGGGGGGPKGEGESGDESGGGGGPEGEGKSGDESGGGGGTKGPEGDGGECGATVSTKPVNGDPVVGWTVVTTTVEGSRVHEDRRG